MSVTKFFVAGFAESAEHVIRVLIVESNEDGTVGRTRISAAMPRADSDESAPTPLR